MKRFFLYTAMLVVMPLSMQAQDDDMYFFPSKSKAEKLKERSAASDQTYYSGSSRDVDEYNRMGGSTYDYLGADSTLQDVIDFDGIAGVYPDSVGEYELTRKMSRWDGYEPSQAYWSGYQDGRNDEWSMSHWHSPWYYSYYPWYDSWGYDPWYYSSWHYAWYDPWYYDPWYIPGYRYGYYRPYWGGGYSRRSALYARNGNTGTISRYDGHRGRFTGVRSSTSSISRRPTGTTVRNTGTSSNSVSRNSNLGNIRSSSSSSSSNRSTYTPNTSSSSNSSIGNSQRSGSFGGSRGGSVGGGSRSGSIGGSSRMGGRR